MEPISSVPNQSAESTIYTGGGAYIGGNVVAETFIGSDQYNYYFVGLAPLVHDPTRRFHNFLNEYLGTPSQPVPFGGRQAQLEELHRWLNDADAPPYYLMTAEAGRGKSALVCRWMEEVRQQRPEVEVIFIPISIRFETAAQDTVFAALAARLAQFYDEPLKPAALSGAQWQGVCESYLDRTPPAGKQLLIILDGLDEASDWQFGAGFFSTDPSPGLRVVVTARLRVGESTPQGWATTLGWHERLTQMATLPPLSRTGIEEALTSMGDPLAGFADQVTIVEQLYRLTEGDPLLVRLYVQEFEKQKATVGTLTSAALQQMTPGLQGYFDQWWKGQKAQWRAQGNDPEKEEAHLRLLLDAFAAALGPVTLDDLAQLHPELGSSRLIRAQLQSVERWVIGDGKTQGYSYSHARLGYYFWEQLSDQEQTAWDERFCAWGATTLAALNAEQLDPKAAPVYLLRHYSEHLKRSHAPAEAFYALISNGWRRAWEELDISYAGFLGDVDRARQCANENYDLAKTGKAVVLIQQVKAALCKASIVAIRDKISPHLLVQAVQAGLRTPAQALVIAKLASTEKKRADMLSALIPNLPAALLDVALDVARSVEHASSRFISLYSFILYLPTEQSEKIVSEALTVARLIEHECPRSEALGRLIPYLSMEQRQVVLSEALTAARSIDHEYYHARLLSGLAPHLPPEERQVVLSEALTAARSIDDVFLRAEALSYLIPYLSLRQSQEALDEMLIAAHSAENVFSYIKALSRLTPHLSAEQRQMALDETLILAHSFDYAPHRAEALSCLIPYLLTEQRQATLSEALAAAYLIEDESSRVKVLSYLAPRLPIEQRQAILGEALTVAHAIGDLSCREIVMVTLASYLPVTLLGEALTMARLIDDKFWRAWMLSNLAPCLPAEQCQAVLGEAMTVARLIEDVPSRTWMIDNVAHMPTVLISKLLTVAHSKMLAVSTHSLANDLHITLGPAYCVWIESLAVLAAQPRSELLSNLAHHMPFILALAGDEAPQAAEGIYHAIQEVCGWWP